MGPLRGPIIRSYAFKEKSVEVFDISYSAIFKVVISGVFVYVIFPLLLALRDLVLLKTIEKLILTDELHSYLRICESDRWFLNNKYNKKQGIDFTENETAVYTLDGEEVSTDAYNSYISGYNLHYNRFIKLDSFVNLRHNLIIFLTKHYKSEDFKSPIPNLRDKEYSKCNEEYA